MKDSLKIRDELEINDGVLNIPHTSARMIGEVTIEEIDPLGNIVFSSTEYNDITIGGATFVLEQMFKKVSDNMRFRLSGLNSAEKELIGGTGWSEKVTNADLASEKIFGFMIGIGGEDGIAVRSPKFITTALDSFIPFRMHTLNDSDSIKNKIDNYAMARTIKVNDNSYKGYYIKKFSDTENASSGIDTSVQIIPEYTDGSGLVTSENLGTTDSPIYTYAKVIMEIDTEDVREYFRAKDGVLTNCRINQLGLVAGREVASNNGVTEFDDVKLVTIVNFKGRELNNDENTIRFRYKIYCM